MTSSEDAPSEDVQPSPDRAAQLRAMGAVLRNVTTDETEEGWGHKSPDAFDAALRRDVPPHHGG